MAEQIVPTEASNRQKCESGTLLVSQDSMVLVTEQFAVRNGGLMRVIVSVAI